jgi:hypothetical protein
MRLLSIRSGPFRLRLSCTSINQPFIVLTETKFSVSVQTLQSRPMLNLPHRLSGPKSPCLLMRNGTPGTRDASDSSDDDEVSPVRFMPLAAVATPSTAPARRAVLTYQKGMNHIRGWYEMRKNGM